MDHSWFMLSKNISNSWTMNLLQILFIQTHEPFVQNSFKLVTNIVTYLSQNYSANIVHSKSWNRKSSSSLPLPLTRTFHLRCNPRDSKIDGLPHLLALISFNNLQPSKSDSIIWSPSSNGLFSISSFFSVLSFPPSPPFYIFTVWFPLRCRVFFGLSFRVELSLVISFNIFILIGPYPFTSAYCVSPTRNRRTICVVTVLSLGILKLFNLIHLCWIVPLDVPSLLF